MKSTITIIASLVLLASTAPSWAQDEDLMLDEPDDTETTAEDPLSQEDPLAESAEPTSAEVEEVGEDGSSAAPGALGVGLTGILVGAQGAEAVYRLNPELTLVGFLGASIYSPDEGDTSIGLALAAAAFYKLLGAGPATLHLGGRIDFGFRDAGESATHIAIEVPLRAELALAEDLVLHAETGLVASFVPDEGAVLGGGDAGATNLRIGGQLLSSFGLTFFF